MNTEENYIGIHRSSRSDGYARSYVTYLSEGGDVFGNYTAFNDDDTFEVLRLIVHCLSDRD